MRSLLDKEKIYVRAQNYDCFNCGITSCPEYDQACYPVDLKPQWQSFKQNSFLSKKYFGWKLEKEYLPTVQQVLGPILGCTG